MRKFLCVILFFPFPAFTAGAIKRARMHVRVDPDPAATSPAALPSRVLDWDGAAGPGTCAQVLVNPRAEQ